MMLLVNVVTDRSEVIIMKTYFMMKHQVKQLSKRDYNILSFLSNNLYRTGAKECFNADCNSVLNILRKSNDNCKDKSKVVSMSTLCCSGALNTPVRIKNKVNLVRLTNFLIKIFNFLESCDFRRGRFRNPNEKKTFPVCFGKSYKPIPSFVCYFWQRYTY